MKLIKSKKSLQSSCKRLKGQPECQMPIRMKLHQFARKSFWKNYHSEFKTAARVNRVLLDTNATKIIIKPNIVPVEKGITKTSSSFWSSSVVLVKKKFGLTSITKKDSYQPPWIDNTLDTLAGSFRLWTWSQEMIEKSLCLPLYQGYGSLQSRYMGYVIE